MSAITSTPESQIASLGQVTLPSPAEFLVPPIAPLHLMKPKADPFQPWARFTAILFTIEGKGGWTFAPIPPDLAPPVTGAWGMTPVIANVDGREWRTTVWKDKTRRSLLPIPKKIRRQKGDGDSVEVKLCIDQERALGPMHPIE